MSVNKTKTDLGRSGFQHRVAVKSVGPVGPNGSTVVNSIFVRPGQVTYSPYVVAGWRQRIADVRDATSSLIGTKSAEAKSRYFHASIFNGYPGNQYRYAVGSGEIFSTGFVSLPTKAPSTLSKAQALAAERFVADYYAKTRSIRGGSVLAEAAQTIRGLASPAKALRKEVDNLYQTLRKRMYRNDRAGAKATAEVVSGTWLEWNFGINPLVDDVNGAADAVNRMRDGDFRASVPVRGVGVEELMRQYAAYGIAIGGDTAYHTIAGTVDSWLVDRTHVTIRGAVRVAPPGSEVPPVMQWGLGFEDVAPAFWEAIPWSWFVDYFTNVSTVIDAWSMLDSRLGWCNRTIRNSTTRVVSDLRARVPGAPFPGYAEVYSAGDGHAEASYTSTLRSPVNWADVAPPLRLRLPGTGTKWANLAALSAMYRGKPDTRVWKNLKRRIR